MVEPPPARRHETSTLTTEDVTVADGLPVEDDEVTEPEVAEVAADESYRPDWWSRTTGRAAAPPNRWRS